MFEDWRATPIHADPQPVAAASLRRHSGDDLVTNDDATI
jgi:hypothetical protein